MANKKNRQVLSEEARRLAAAEAAKADSAAAKKARKTANKKAERLRKKLAGEQRAAAEEEADTLLTSRRHKAITAEIRNFFFEKTADLSLEDKGAILRNVVDHQEVRAIRDSAGLSSSKQAELHKDIVDNAAEVLQTFNKRGSLTKDKTVFKRALVSALVSDNTVSNKRQKATAEALGFKRHIIRKSVGHRKRAFTGEGLWALADRARRSDALSVQHQELVVRFWTEQTRVLPNEKDVRRHRLGRNQYENHPIHLLEKSQVRYFNSVF